MALIWMERHCQQTKLLVLVFSRRGVVVVVVVEVLVSRAVRAALTRGDWPRILWSPFDYRARLFGGVRWGPGSRFEVGEDGGGLELWRLS